MADWNLVVPFLSDDPIYVDGVALGLLYARCKRRPRVIREMVPERAEEQTRLLMTRLGYGMTRRKTFAGGWVGLTFRR